MASPKFQEITLPMLKLAADGQVWSLADAREELAKHFQLTEEDIEELLPSGRQARFANRVAWAKVYLERGGLLSSSKRAHFQITDRGREVLKRAPTDLGSCSAPSGHLLIAVARGEQTHDKHQAQKDRDWVQQRQRLMKQS